MCKDSQSLPIASCRCRWFKLPSRAMRWCYLTCRFTARKSCGHISHPQEWSARAVPPHLAHERHSIGSAVWEQRPLAMSADKVTHILQPSTRACVQRQCPWVVCNRVRYLCGVNWCIPPCFVELSDISPVVLPVVGLRCRIIHVCNFSVSSGHPMGAPLKPCIYPSIPSCHPELLHETN